MMMEQVAREKAAVQEHSGAHALACALEHVLGWEGMPVVLLNAPVLTPQQPTPMYWQQPSVHWVWCTCRIAPQRHMGPHLHNSAYGSVHQLARP